MRGLPRDGDDDDDGGGSRASVLPFHPLAGRRLALVILLLATTQGEEKKRKEMNDHYRPTLKLQLSKVAIIIITIIIIRSKVCFHVTPMTTTTITL